MNALDMSLLQHVAGSATGMLIASIEIIHIFNSPQIVFFCYRNFLLKFLLSMRPGNITHYTVFIPNCRLLDNYYSITYSFSMYESFS